jgi:putative transposase
MSAKTKPTSAITGYRYRLEPAAHHARRLNALAGACRWVWNHFLHWREDAYLAARAAGGSLPKGAFGYVANAAELTRLRKLLPWLRAADVTGLQQTLRDLDKAYAKFFAGEAGHPHSRQRGDDRYRVCGQASFAVDGDWVRLPKLGWIRLRRSRELPAGRNLNVTVTREGAHWFVSFCVQHDLATTPAPSGPAVGLDLGVAQSVTTSVGDIVQFPVSDEAEERFVRRLQRQLSRKSKGSNRRKLAISRLAKRRRHIASRVEDAAHKFSTTLATTHREIHLEDLRLKKMTASARGSTAAPGHHIRAKAGLNRALLAQAHGQFVRFLTYKCERSGARLIFKNPAYTSQECAECGHTDKANRTSQAVFRCVKCGHTENADRNAARVVLQRPADGRSVAARGGSRKVARKGRRSDETRTQLRTSEHFPSPTGIPVKAAQAA